MARLKISLHGSETSVLALEEGREYHVGRAEDCDVRLENLVGISRAHFRLRHDGKHWLAEAISKFATLAQGGASSPSIRLEDGASFQVPPYSFAFEDAAVDFAPASDGSREAASAPAPQASGPAAEPARPDAEPSTFAGDDEATAIVPSPRLVPYLRYLPRTGHAEREIRLEHGPWLAGRDEDTAIPLNDPKASRRQFEIAQSARGWSIKDLGSSNGTSLNGKTLPANEPLTLKSGDAITVQSIEMVFEARDASFAKKAASLPMVVALSPYAYAPAQQPFYDVYSLPIESSGPGGAVPYRSEASARRGARPRGRVLVIGISVILVVLAFLFAPVKKENATATATATERPDIAKLSLAERQRIDNFYELAGDMYLRQKYEMALQQLEMIHKSLPNGYKGSLELKERIENTKRALDEQETIRRQREELQRQEAEVREIVAKCRPVAEKTSKPEEIRGCLEKALQIKPDDQEAQGLLDVVERKQQLEEARRTGNAAFAASAGRGRALWLAAESLRKAGKRREAIAAYRKHVRSQFPDPDDLKAKSQAAIASIRHELDSEIQALENQAQQALDHNDHRGALVAAQKALAIDPESARAQEIGSKAKADLEAQLQALYADSVVSENFGQLEAAKDKWKKIIEMDRAHGDYWQKARSKLNTYGGN
jgi:pSer/pThr/pTyr-binding forkhead associated (FHA) protein/tetratricopeptide (TPR) repeat protein